MEYSKVSEVLLSGPEFDLCQLAKVVEVCRTSKSRAEAGKKLFAVSRKQRNTTNDSDRLGKYLEKFGLTFQKCKDLY